MQQNPSFFVKFASIFLGVVVLALASQWYNFNWGRVEQGQATTITVTGKADTNQANQIATFRAGVTVDHSDRNIAVELVNSQVAELIEQVKAFGIADEDLKTENISVYEYKEPIEDYMIMPANMGSGNSGSPVGTQTQWQASNSLVVTVRDLSRVSELATILTNAGATTVSGPIFEVDDTSEAEKALLGEAMEDARERADAILAGTGQKVVRVLNAYENDYYQPYPAYDRMSGVSEQTNVPVEPGSQQIIKTVSVTYEISR